MKHLLNIHCAGVWLVVGLWCSAPIASDGATVDYSKDIAPVLQQSCGKCHSGSAAMGQLRLDSQAAVLRGGKSGPAIIPGKSSDSLLIKRVLGLTDGPRMPMGGDPLPARKVQLLRAWVDKGDFSEAKAEAAKGEAVQAGGGGSSPLFATKVRPILSARCYQCHGPETQQAGLRLDSLNAILKGSDSGKIVVPGHSSDSRIIRRLLAKERPQMPYGGPPLSPDEISTIQEWIDKGAPGPDSTQPTASTKPLKHWAYIKPVTPPIPNVSNPSWVRNPIDNFILAKLDKEGLKPSPEADKATLIRRVYLDLIGLPPSPREVDEFLSDRSSDAYEKVVDHLLASPHYGERWARQWLDMARYADTNGYEKDNRRTAWEYRDWVIRALNQDMSFKDFTIDQIAGDMLPNPTKDQLIATGFNRNTMLNQEGGVDPEEYYWYELVDRVNTTASVWLGSTLGCAQCHNHKFDPFTQKDYYRFLAFFSNSEYQVVGGHSEQYALEPDLELPTAEQSVKSKAIRERMGKLQQALDTQTPALDAAQTKWEADMQAAGNAWAPLRPERYESAGGATLTLLPDASILASGKNPFADTYTLTARTNEKQITGVRIEVLNDKSLPHGGPGRDAEGNFFLSEFDVEAAPADQPEAKRHVIWKTAKADEAQNGYDISNLTAKESDVHGWAIDASPTGAAGERQAVLIPDQPFGFPGGTILTVTLKHEMRHATRNLGRFRLSVTSTSEPEFIVRIPARVRPILDIAPEKRTPEQKEKLSASYRAVSPLLDDTRKQMAELGKSLKALGIATAMVMHERPGYARPTAYIRERGSFMSKGDLVYADVPSALGRLPGDAMPNRLGLAQWLVSDDNPLTARVTVNHFWEAIFGHGIVETDEDFGTQGDMPSHPELLDWLATEFMREGWKMKKIQRLIVTSATYRQSSRATLELLARDPYNNLYARSARFREEGEMVHDIALSASGLLSDKMYGPSVFPYQPEGIWDVPYSKDKWVESEGEDRYRRAIYTFMRRSAPYPSLVTFDAPSREFCTIRRVRTNTPLQALTALNDPYFFDAARALAKRMVNEGGTDDASRVTYGFKLTVSRNPTQAELDRVLSFYQQQLQRYRQDTAAAVQTINAEPSANSSQAPELAAWTMVANVLLNMDETISKE
ncbi:MAG: DUF1553 domain-containing protein [Bryobacteraceae bacterium]